MKAKAPVSPLTFTGRLRSVRSALNGIGCMLRTQQNAWIHAAATVGVIGAGLHWNFSPSEWCWMVVAAIAVWASEALNTALELLTDVVCPEFHPVAGKAKDVAAGAVLISAFGAALIGSIIIGPYLFQ